MKTRLTSLMLALLIALPGLSPAAPPEQPVIYTIKKGDTLWGLSDRFIKDPGYWPDMWSKNSMVTNPHFIYPGQKIRVFEDRLEIVADEPAAPKPPAAPAANADIVQDVAEEKTFAITGSESFLAPKELKPAGHIVGIHHDRIMAGGDDIIYTDIGTEQGAKGGDKFSVLRVENFVSHPVTNEIMGRKVVPLGTLQLTDLERTSSRAIVTKNYREISAGSYLLPEREDRQRTVVLKMPSRDLKGYIIESYTGSNIIAAGDIVHIDLGTSQGAEKGNMLYIVRDVSIDQRYTEGRIARFPQELLGALVILEINKKTAMALVVKSIDAIYRGDKIIAHIK